ncbi:GerAB/ArcD/ProY family transporter [Paenibacillus pinistramenti]|uniref:GerAB/ArcD/ProY family transporter n=1 Tax=Paenibacillus pinistramenti TaxID=1768003 RepID=UPI0011092E23|nr:endospore germination permease [Paenibacillus pinistramenti]
MRISNQQLFWMIMMLNVGINLLIAISLVIQDGHQDAWMSSMISGLIGVAASYLGTRLALRHPGQTLVEFSGVILGKWLGKLILLPYLFQWYIVIPLIMRDQYTFVHINVLFMTPVWMVVGPMLLVIVYAVYHGGIEAIARCTQVWSPILLVILLITFGVTINNLDWKALFPVYALTGAGPILKGSLVPAALLGESVNVMMLAAFVDKPGRGTQRAAVSGVLLAALFITIGILWVIMTFGWHIASKLKYPFFDMVKLVYLMEFIQNMDVFIMAVWLVSIFIKMSVYVFVASYGTAQWVGKTGKWRSFIWLPAVTTFILAMLIIRMNVPNRLVLNYLWVGTILPLNSFLIPLLLLIVSVIRFPAGSGKPGAVQPDGGEREQTQTAGEASNENQDSRDAKSTNAGTQGKAYYS